MPKTDKQISDVRHCLRCGLPDLIPGVVLSPGGLCSTCSKTPNVEALKEKKLNERNKVAELFSRQCNEANAYDCVLAFSGGKDSSYTLKILVEKYQLRVLAVTIDNGYISKAALENCRVVTDELGADHVLFKPSKLFIRDVYKKSAVDNDLHPPAAILRASAICNSCITIINSYVMNLALMNSCSIIAGGYIGGQLPMSDAIMKISLAQHSELSSYKAQKFVENFGLEAKQYFTQTEKTDLETIWIVNPMIGEQISEAEIIDKISALGWKKPNDTGKSSTNCLINDLGIYSHIKQHGFNPYSHEIADQVRHGLISRDVAMKKYTETVIYDDVEWLFDDLGIQPF